MSYNCIFVIGPTAVGKTAIGVRVADKFGGEIISADSRQVYKGLDIGSGKDLADYALNGKTVPYHLIDVCDLRREYNLFDFQEDFYKAFSDISSRGKIPVCVGGTGMYLDSILRSYDMIPFAEKEGERAELEKKSEDELRRILTEEKERLHNTSEFGGKERMIKSILINRFNMSEECRAARERLRASRPRINPLVIGTTLDRALVRKRIEIRLSERMREGLIEEVENLHSHEKENGASWSRLEALGLEYRFVSGYLQGRYKSLEEMRDLLLIAIGQFAKRQETWFRCMEKKGIEIRWLPPVMSVEERFNAACRIIEDRWFSKR